MTDASTAVSAAPFVDILQPYITAVVTTVAGAVVTLAAAAARKYLKISIDQGLVDIARDEAQKQAGLLIAKSATSLATQSIDAHSPEVARATNWAATEIPKVLSDAKITPDDFAHMIAAEVGKLTAPVTQTTVFAPPSGSVTKAVGSIVQIDAAPSATVPAK
jgi:hypothetical protein